MAKGMGVHCGNVTLELRVFAVLAVNGELGLEDVLLIDVALVALLGLAECRTDELGVGGVKVLAQLLDEIDKIQFVAAGVSGIVTILVALPEEEPRDLVPLRSRVILVKVRKHFLRIRGVIVILLAGIPFDGSHDRQYFGSTLVIPS